MNNLELRAGREIVRIKTLMRLRKNSPTVSAVHVDSVMGSKKKKKKADSPAWQRSAGKNPKGGLNAKGRASYKRETGGTLKPPVKAGDNPRRASFLARMGNMAGPERDENGEPTRLLLSLQAWGAKSKADARKKAKAISARNEVQKFNPNHDELGRFDSGAGTGYDSGMTTNGESGTIYNSEVSAKAISDIGRGVRSALKQAIQSGELPADLDITVKSISKDIQRSRTSRGKHVRQWTQAKKGLVIRVPEKQYYEMTENQRKLINKIAIKYQVRTKIYDTQGVFSSTVESYAVDFFYDTGGDYD